MRAAGDVMIAYQVLGESPFDVVIAPGSVSHVELQWEAAYSPPCRLLRHRDAVRDSDHAGVDAVGTSTPWPALGAWLSRHHHRPPASSLAGLGVTDALHHHFQQGPGRLRVAHGEGTEDPRDEQQAAQIRLGPDLRRPVEWSITAISPK